MFQARTVRMKRTNMTLSQMIKLSTSDGRNIVDFLVDVMEDHYKDFRMCHRLDAAKLLTTYGNEDAPNFIDDNTPDPSSKTRKRKPRRPNKFDTELARVIKEDTDGGHSIARFLVNVMEGEFTRFKPHHRMAAARELLDRGFGKSARKEATSRRSGEGRNPETHAVKDSQSTSPTDDTNEITKIPESQESEFRQPTEEQTLTPHSSPLTPNQADVLDTLTHLQPDHFEQTVLDLLEAIGYRRGRHLGRPGDGGIDGIIDLDPLGIEKLYVQAKRWIKPVGEPEIRDFSGSLDPHSATKGLFITTSGFTGPARRAAKTISAGHKHIRLVDGEELAQLMISQNMGVETVTAHRARKQQEDHPAQHT